MQLVVPNYYPVFLLVVIVGLGRSATLIAVLLPEL